MRGAGKYLSSNGRDSRFKKTQLCVFYRDGCCSFGSACSFAHDESEIEIAPNLAKTALCKDWKEGRCPLSSQKCRFAHGKHELRSKPNSSSGPPVSQIPKPVKFKAKSNHPGLAHGSDGGGAAAVHTVTAPSPPARVPETPQRVRDLLTVRTPSTPMAPQAQEPMFVMPSFAGLGSTCVAMKAPSPRSAGLSRWDKWDNDTAVPETSSEDDGGYMSPMFEHEADCVGASNFCAGIDQKAPPGLGLRNMVGPDLAPYGMTPYADLGLDLVSRPLAPPGLDEYA